MKDKAKAIPKAIAEAEKKAISKAKVALGTISVTALSLAVALGVATPAIAPSKAEAQVLVFKKYENATRLQPKELVELLQAVGFQGQDLKNAWAIAMKESRGNALSFNGNKKTGDHSYGLFQINMLGQMGADRRSKLGLAYDAQLLNPVVNAKVAYYMSGKGKNWSAWKGTHTAVVQQWLKQYPYQSKAISKAKPKATAKGKAIPKAKHK